MQNPETLPDLDADLSADMSMEDSGLPDLPDMPDMPDLPDMPGEFTDDFSGGMSDDFANLDGSGGPERRDDSDENAYRRSIFDVPVTVNISVGRKKLSVAELLELKPDAVIALAANLEDPVDLTIDDRVIARGELIETEEGTLAVRITEIEERSHG